MWDDAVVRPVDQLFETLIPSLDAASNSTSDVRRNPGFEALTQGSRVHPPSTIFLPPVDLTANIGALVATACGNSGARWIKWDSKSRLVVRWGGIHVLLLLLRQPCEKVVLLRR